MDCQKSLVDHAALGYRRSCSFQNLERGEIVSPLGCIADKGVGLDLATPDARHRRPLKILQSTSFFSNVLRKPRGEVPIEMFA